MANASTVPVRYHSDVERLEPNEAATSAEIVNTLRSISETTFRNGGHAIRAVHAKAHALLTGELEVLDRLPAELAQGLFSAPGRYPVVMRISTIPGDVLDDNVSVPRGLGVKVIGVTGERLEGSENGTTQDFVLVNSPAFGAATGAKFLKSLKLVALTTDRAPGLKKALSSTLQGVAGLIGRFGGDGGALHALGGHPETNPLGETYFSQAPIRYGEFIAKVCVAPVSPELMALEHAPVDLSGKPDGLREAAIAHFRTLGGVWELRVQLCTDLDKMPVEDSSVEWPQSLSPYVAVARITVAPQDAWSEDRARRLDDGLAFSPWNGLAAHRPLGSIMRIRKPAYQASSGFRAEHNGCPMAEPSRMEDIAG